jgi:hypothetical protein
LPSVQTLLDDGALAEEATLDTILSATNAA